MRDDVPTEVRLIGGIVAVTACLAMLYVMLPVFIGCYSIYRGRNKDKLRLTKRGIERYRRRHPGHGEATFLPGLFFRTTRRPSI